MFFWINAAGTADIEVVSHKLFFGQASTNNTPTIASGLSKYHPLEFARATNGYVYMVDGLNSPIKWDGVSQDTKSVGNAAPSTAPTLAFSGAGDITGDYVAYVRFVDEDGNVTNLSPVSAVATASSHSTAEYTGVPVPDSDKIVRRQILRNTAGQYLVFYVDIDTLDLTSTSFTSTRSDTSLRTQTAVALFDPDTQRSLASRHGLPPNDKPIIVFHDNRLWMYGEVVYDRGNVAVTNGSTAVTGYGTAWTTEMAGRLLYVQGGSEAYEISSVDEAAQTLVLLDTYQGATDLFADYKIRPFTARRNLLHYSEEGLYDSWPATQSLAIAASDDIDDDPTGLASTHSFLYIFQRRHIYRLTFLQDPAYDGGVFLAARRGCVNNRCWVSVDGFIYALDDQGIYRFDGTDSAETISQNIQDLFYFDSNPGELRINWRASQWFHCSHDRHDSTIRWFVSFSGDRLPRHAICLNYSVPQWWIEEYPFAVGDSTVLKGVNTASIVAGKINKVYALQVGALDVVDPADGDTRALAQGWTRRSVALNDETSLPTAGVVGAPLAIVEGAGKGQVRRITSVSGTTLTVDSPFTTALDTDQTGSLQNVSVVQIGAMPWRWRSGWLEWPDMPERQQPRKVAVSFKRTVQGNKVDLRIYKEYANEPEQWEITKPRTSLDRTSIRTTDGSPDAVIDATVATGYCYLTIDSFDFWDEYRDGVVSVELAGFSGASPFKVFEIDVYGAANE